MEKTDDKAGAEDEAQSGGGQDRGKGQSNAWQDWGRQHGGRYNWQHHGGKKGKGRSSSNSQGWEHSQESKDKKEILKDEVAQLKQEKEMFHAQYGKMAQQVEELTGRLANNKSRAASSGVMPQTGVMPAMQVEPDPRNTAWFQAQMQNQRQIENQRGQQGAPMDVPMDVVNTSGQYQISLPGGRPVAFSDPDGICRNKATSLVKDLMNLMGEVAERGINQGWMQSQLHQRQSNPSVPDPFLPQR